MPGYGFVELRASAAVGVDGTPWQLVERARPELEIDLSERVVLGTAVEASFSQGRRLQTELERTLNDSDFAQVLDLAGCAWPPPPRNTWLGVDRATDYLRVDRLYVDVYQPGFDLRVGRQAVQWGSALLINPTDPFPEVLFVEPWRPRAGVNAAKLTVPFGEGASNAVQVVAGVDDAFEAARIAGRGTLHVGVADVSLIGAYRGVPDGEVGSGLVGVDVKGTAVVGYWLEGAVHLDPTDDGLDAHEEIAVGVDYSFPVLDTLLVGAQYYRNGAGVADPDDYDAVSRTSEGMVPPDCDDPQVAAALAGADRDPFAPFTLGRDYALVQTVLRVTPDVTVAAVALQNLRDGTGVAIPQVTVRPTGAVEVALMAQTPYRVWGRTGEFKPAPPDLVVDMAGGFGGELEVDFNGMVPDATFIASTRVSF